ncbi:MAG: efflux RND transporter permease subunit [Spirochaetota bacterium]
MIRPLTYLAKKPLLVLVVILAVSALFVWAMAQNASLETNLDAYMPSEHPTFQFSDEAEEIFGIEDAVLIALEHPETIYNPQTLEKIKQITIGLTEEFEEIALEDVTSLYTADNIIGSEWGLEVEPFYEEVPESPEALEELRAAVESNSLIYGRNVSTDGRSALIIAQIDQAAFDEQFYEELQSFASQWEGPETTYIAGRPVVEGEMARLGPKDMLLMGPLVIIVMTVLLLVLLRSFRDTLVNLFIVLLGTLTAFGVMALMNVPVYAVDTMIPVMLVAIGVAYGIHMHNAVHHTVRSKPDIGRKELVHTTLTAMIRPVSMAAVTTAIGFTALMTSQVLPVRYFGLFSAIGVLTEMLLALVLYPLSIMLLGPPKRGRELEDDFPDYSKDSALTLAHKQRGKAILDHPKRVVISAIIVVVVAGFGASYVWIDTSFLANFQSDSEVVKTDNFVNKHFGGTSTLNVILTSDTPETFKEPEVLSLTDQLQQEIEEESMVGGSLSLTQFIKRMNMVMHDDKQEEYRIPDSRELVAQYLLLYEMAGDAETLEQVVDYDYQQANVTFQLKSDSSAVMEEIIRHIDQYEQEYNELGITVRYAGSGFKALTFADLLLEGQIISLLLSFVLVAVILALLFKSVLTGLVGIIPIAITAAINFGTMGILGIPLSSATALISSIAVGIGVDYAIHLIEHYRTVRIHGLSIRDAAYETAAHTGRAIIYNAVAVMGGFAVMLFSVFPPNRQVGGLVALNMATSAVGTLTVLLVIIVALDKRGKLLPQLSREDTKKN